MSDRTAQTELPPPMVFMQLLFGKQLTYSLSGVARLGVADHMGKTGSAVEELAAKVGGHAPSLYRVMRMLASLGVFKESPPRHFALTPVGELLKTDAPGSLRYMAMMFGEEFSTRAYAHFTECLRTGGDGVSEAYGKDIWQVLAERPAQCEVFQNAMTANSSGSVPAIIEAYDLAASSGSPMSAAGTGFCSPRSCARPRKCEAYCSIAPRWWEACPRAHSPTLRGGSPSREEASSSACRMDATLTS